MIGRPGLVTDGLPAIADLLDGSDVESGLGRLVGLGVCLLQRAWK